MLIAAFMVPLVNCFVCRTYIDKQQEQTGSYTKKASLSIANKNNFTSATAIIETLPERLLAWCGICSI